MAIHVSFKQVIESLNHVTKPLEWARFIHTCGTLMGCQITTCLRDQRVDQDEDHETSMPSMLLSLPNEVLVKIMLFLPESRDRVTL